MIPLRDNIPSRTIPFVTWLIIAMNVASFFYVLTLAPDAQETLVNRWGFIARRFFVGLGQNPSNFFVNAFVPLGTSLFLHGGLFHLVGNMYFLHIFGDNVEDRLGHVRYAIFYVCVGIAATLIHAFMARGSSVPTIGASGAIAGVLGAYFLFYPGARVLVLLPIIFFFNIIEVPAIFFLGMWFLFQFASGVVAIGAADAGSGGIAWWAHIGGFLCGLCAAPIAAIGRARRRRYYA